MYNFYQDPVNNISRFDDVDSDEDENNFDLSTENNPSTSILSDSISTRTRSKKINVLRINQMMNRANINSQNPGVFSLPDLDNETKRLYIGLNINLVKEPCEAKIVAFFDSGADINLISKSQLQSLFPEIKIEEIISPADVNVTSYTEHKIEVLGKLKLYTQVNSKASLVPISFYVTKEEGTYPALVNSVALGHLGVDMCSYFNENDEIFRPHLVHCDPDILVTSYHLSDQGFYTVSKRVEISPESYSQVWVNMPPYTNVQEGDSVVLTDDFLKLAPEGIKVFESRSICMLNWITRELQCSVNVQNRTKNLFEGVLTFTYEIVNDCDANDIDRTNISISAIEGRPLLSQISPENISMPSPNINDPPQEFDDLTEYPAAQEEPPDSTNDSRIRTVRVSCIGVNQLKVLPKRLFLLENRFPEHSEYYAGDPEAINNNTGVPGKSLTEVRFPVNYEQLPVALANKYEENKDDIIQLGVQEVTEQDLEAAVSDTGGYEVPPEASLTVPITEYVRLETYSPEMQPYIEDLFIKKFPEVVSRHSLDLGDLSKTLGYYNLKLKKHAKLPAFKKIYYLNAEELQQLQVILQFLIDYDAISKVSTAGHDKDLHLDSFCSPSYLIPRSNPNSSARLIVNYRFLNENLQSEAVHLDTPNSVINSFRDCYFFSAMDLSCAFQSIRISEKSKDLTLFSTPLGTYRSNILPTGVKTSPNVLASIMHKCIHHKVLYDENGKMLLDDKGFPAMEFDPIDGVKNIYDDVILGTPLKSNFEETLRVHMKTLEKVLKRLHTHRGKLSFPKCKFAKTIINFFGMFITANKCYPDPKRILDVLNLKFPVNLKAARHCFGVINTLREFLKHLYHLDLAWVNDLLKTSKGFKPTQEHMRHFELFKQALTQASLYTAIVDPAADKLLFTDSSVGSHNYFSGVLAQIVKPNIESGVIYPPQGINLADKNHRLIYDDSLSYTPLPLLKEGQTLKDYKLRQREGHPPEHDYLEQKYFGWDDNDADYSLVKTLELVYQFQDHIIDMDKVIKALIKDIVEHAAKYKFLTYFGETDAHKPKYSELMRTLKRGIIPIDSEMIIFGPLANALKRPIRVISAYYAIGEEDGKPTYLRDFGDNSGPMVILLLYKCNLPQKCTPDETTRIYEVDDNLEPIVQTSTHSDTYFVARPAYHKNYDSYPLKRFVGQFEIVAYMSKSIPCKHDQSHVIEMELSGMLSALLTFRKLIGRANLMLFTDNKCLYYLFHPTMVETSAKIYRWHKKVIDDYPQLVFGFVRSKDNISDFLTRNFEIEKPCVRRLGLPRFINGEDLDLAIPKDKFEPLEWERFVRANPQFLDEITTPDERIDNNFKVNVIPSQRLINRKVVSSIVKVERNLRNVETKLLTPLEILRDNLSYENMVDSQKEEYKDIYSQCLSKDANEPKEIDGELYYIQDNLLFIENEDFTPQIFLPNSMLNKMVALGHLLTSHQGLKKMTKVLENFYHSKMAKRINDLCTTCFACQMVNYPTKAQRLCYYKTDEPPMTTICLDLMENLPDDKGYKHLLMITCPISGFTFSFPLKSKTSDEFLHNILYSIIPYYPVHKILCDSGSLFVSNQTLERLFINGVTVLYSASHHSRGHGSAEGAVKNLKVALKKTLVSDEKYHWYWYVPSLMRMYNTSKITKLGYSPSEILFGPSNSMNMTHFTDFVNLSGNKIIPRLRTRKSKLRMLGIEKTELFQKVRKYLDQERKNRIEKTNKTRVRFDVDEGTMVLVKNHRHLTGRPNAFVPYYQYSLYSVTSVGESTCCVKRVTDHLIGLKEKHELGFIPKRIRKLIGQEYKLPKDQIKILNLLPKDLRDLPVPILKILAKNVEDLDNEDLNFLASKDDYDLPDQTDAEKRALDKEIEAFNKQKVDENQSGDSINQDDIGVENDNIVNEPESLEDSDSEEEGNALPRKTRRSPKHVKFNDNEFVYY